MGQLSVVPSNIFGIIVCIMNKNIFKKTEADKPSSMPKMYNDHHAINPSHEGT